MINELYELSEALDKAGVQTQSWHRKYKPIPNIRVNAPCVRILISEGTVMGLSTIKGALGMELRKFGTNQGSYPCMNLAPLYRITDNTIKEKLAALRPRGFECC